MFDNGSNNNNNGMIRDPDLRRILDRQFQIQLAEYHADLIRDPVGARQRLAEREAAGAAFAKTFLTWAAVAFVVFVGLCVWAFSVIE